MAMRLSEMELIEMARRHRDEAGAAQQAGDARKARELDRLATHAEAMAARVLERYFQPAV
jgi:hypothetical protein